MSVRLERIRSGPPDASTVVLAGSLGTTHAMWQPQISPLAERFDVIAYDHRGHGGSDVVPGPYSIPALGEDVVAMLDELEVERASLCGVSLGGMVAMWVAAAAPRRVESLVLICTSTRLGSRKSWEERAAAVRSHGVSAVADAVLARWFTPAFRDEHPAIVASHRQMLVAQPSEGYAGCCEAIRDMDLRVQAAAITAPTLVIAGSADPATPPDHARRLAAAIPHARAVVLSDAAHLASVEQAQPVTAAILEHVGGSSR